jgi:hypothetical protein
MMKDSKSIVVGIAASAAVLIATPVVPQPAQKDQEQANPATQGKRDILGFKLGMTKMEVEAAGGKCSPDWDRYRSCSAQKDGQLILRFQEYAESKLVWLIRYRFTSGSGMDQMIQNVSEQFGRQPTTSPGITEWPGSRRETASGMLLGIPAASWWFGDGSSLGLFGHGGIAPPFDYELELSSQTLAKLDYKAKDEADEANRAKQRAINPKPKF